MNKMLVAVFDNETQAYEGLNALKNLHENGDITLYANAVVSKDDTGQLHIAQEADPGPIGTATGLLTGSLIGLLGGPVGWVIGAGTGIVAGLAFDVDHTDVNSTFVDEVSSALTTGKTALIAEMEETWTVPVDTRLEALNGMVFRRLRYEVVEDQFNRESDAMAAEYNDLKEEVKEAKEADKARINNAIAKLKNKAQVTREQIQKKTDEVNSQMNAKVQVIEEQMKDARERRKARLQKRITSIKEQYKARTDKLKQASRLINEAFGSKEEVQKSAVTKIH